MKNSIIITSYNYFGDMPTQEFNARVLYAKNGKTYLCDVYVDYFNKRVYTNKKQKLECGKVLKGLDSALLNYLGL